MKTGPGTYAPGSVCVIFGLLRGLLRLQLFALTAAALVQVGQIDQYAQEG